jgi:hypothetical protein
MRPFFIQHPKLSFNAGDVLQPKAHVFAKAGPTESTPRPPTFAFTPSRGGLFDSPKAPISSFASPARLSPHISQISRRPPVSFIVLFFVFLFFFPLLVFFIFRVHRFVNVNLRFSAHSSRRFV